MRILLVFVSVLFVSIAFGQITSGTMKIETKVVHKMENISIVSERDTTRKIHFTPEKYVIQRKVDEQSWYSTYFEGDSVIHYAKNKYDNPKVARTTLEIIESSVKFTNPSELRYNLTTYPEETMEIAGFTCYKIVVELERIETADFQLFDEEPFPGASEMMKQNSVTHIIAYVTDDIQFPFIVGSKGVDFTDISWPGFPMYYELVSPRQKFISEVINFSDQVTEDHVHHPKGEFEEISVDTDYLIFSTSPFLADPSMIF